MTIKLRIRDGFWHMDAPYRDQSGKPKRLQRSTHVSADREEAFALEVAVKLYSDKVSSITQLPAAVAQDPTKVTLEMAFAQLKASQEADSQAVGTIELTDYQATSVYRFFPKSTVIAEITAQRVVAFVLHMRKTEELAPTTIRQYVAALNRAIQAAGFPRVKPPKIKVTKKSSDRLAPMDQLEKIIQHLTPKWRDHVRFYRHTGIRLSEIQLIYPRHVHLAEDYVQVPGTKTEGSDREVPLTPDAKAIVARLLPGDPHKPLFPVWKYPHTYLDRAAKRAGVGRVSNNDLRRSFATDLLLADETESKVAALLGHKSTKMVQEHYGKLRKQGGKLLASVLKLKSFAPPTEPPTEPEEEPEAAE